VTASLDVRHPDDTVLHTAVAALAAAATACADARGVRVATRTILEQDAVATDTALTQHLAEAAARAGIPAKKMVSGAGHDAMIVARTLPVAILFLCSPAGLSHHPDESVRPEDVAAALATTVEFVTLLAGQTHDILDKEAHA
jgi:allantoate deiminase